MKTQYFTATSLDGFIATEQDSLDWLFALGDLNDSSYPAFIADVGALAMGSAVIEGANLRFVNGDVQRAHAEMRVAAGIKNIWIVGGGDLAGQFYDAGLLDELIIQVGSATLGKGKPLLPRRVLSPVLQLTSATRLGAGMAELRYEIRKHRPGRS